MARVSASISATRRLTMSPIETMSHRRPLSTTGMCRNLPAVICSITASMVASSRQGKEVFHETTEAGRALVERYREVRAACLLPAVAGDLGDVQPLAQAAQSLRALSGLYDQAARAAASL